MCHLSLTPRTYWEVISDRQRTGPRESHPSEDLSELPPLRDPATRWFPNVMDYSDLKQGCGWTGVPLCPFPVMAAPGAARFLQAAVTRSYRTGLYARPIMIVLCLFHVLFHISPQGGRNIDQSQSNTYLSKLSPSTQQMDGAKVDENCPPATEHSPQTSEFQISRSSSSSKSQVLSTSEP